MPLLDSVVIADAAFSPSGTPWRRGRARSRRAFSIGHHAIAFAINAAPASQQLAPPKGERLCYMSEFGRKACSTGCRLRLPDAKACRVQHGRDSSFPLALHGHRGAAGPPRPPRAACLAKHDVGDVVARPGWTESASRLPAWLILAHAALGRWGDPFLVPEFGAERQAAGESGVLDASRVLMFSTAARHARDFN